MPGSGADISHLCFFDPAKHFVILFDQQGSGEFIPSASLVANTTEHLIQDMEQLRQMLGLDARIVPGAGHSLFHAGIRREWLGVMEELS